MAVSHHGSTGIGKLIPEIDNSSLSLKLSWFTCYLPIFGNLKSSALKVLLRYVQVFFLIVLILFTACKSSNGLVNNKHKKLKKGEPIPCPMKDC